MIPGEVAENKEVSMLSSTFASHVRRAPRGYNFGW